MNREENIKQEIRENWFKNHRATLAKQGNLTVLEWRNPENGFYAVRYIFDGNKMYVTGDIGEAVFKLTWKADVDSFNGLNITYFHEKVAAFSDDKYDFDVEVLLESLNEWKQQLKDEGVIYNEKKMRDFINDATGCSTSDEFAWECVNDKYNTFIAGIDADYWEWMYKAGNVIPRRVYGYLVGLQMASEQLKNLSLKADALGDFEIRVFNHKTGKAAYKRLNESEQRKVSEIKLEWS